MNRIARSGAVPALFLILAAAGITGCGSDTDRRPLAWNSVTVGQSTGAELVKKNEDGGHRVSRWTKGVMNNPKFPVSPTVRNVPLILVPRNEIGDTTSYTNILATGAEKGYTSPPAETAALIRLIWGNQPNDHAAVVATRGIPHPTDGHEYALSVERSPEGNTWIVAYRLTVEDDDIRRRLFDGTNAFVFACGNACRPNPAGVSAADLAAIRVTQFPGDTVIRPALGTADPDTPVTMEVRKRGAYDFSAGIPDSATPFWENPSAPVTPFFFKQEEHGEYPGVGLAWRAGEFFVAGAVNRHEGFFGIRNGWRESTAVNFNVGTQTLFARFSEHQADGEGYFGDAKGRAVGLTAQKQFELFPDTQLRMRATADRFVGGVVNTKNGTAAIVSSDWNLGTTAHLKIRF